MPTLVFLLAWVLIALAVVFVAMTGGRRDRAPADSRAGRRAFITAVAATILVFGLLAPAVAIIESGESAERGPGGIQLTASERVGREAFVRNCATCHTLAAANAVARVGPDLDVMRPPKELVLDAIEKGRSRGQGQMPANLVTGREAEAVAEYVARVAGRGVEPR